MLFNSFEFLIFYLVVVALFFALPERYRWVLLLAASYWFYMSWRAEYVVLIVASTLINFSVGLGLERFEHPRTRKALLATGICASLGILFGFKYLDFFSTTLQTTLAAVSIFREMPLFEFLLPLGISFYTFQAIGYTIDVYRRETPAEHHLGIFALFVSFFPQLVAGPIERSHRLLPQFRERHPFSPDDAVAGLKLVLWGIFKKLVIADRIAPIVDAIYASPEAFSGPYLLLATGLFAVQIYCDFSGYSDIAIGTARSLGYDLMQNFRRPYFADSVADFWRRWHISLSTWFRDYVYKPLGGNRVARPLWVRNILVVFVLSGAWHGANWTFIAWGAVHGVTLIGSVLTAGIRQRVARAVGLTRVPLLHGILRQAIVVGIVGVAWVFFRAQSLDDALAIIARFGEFEGATIETLWSLGQSRFHVAVSLVAIVVLICVEAVQENQPRFVERLWANRAVRWSGYATAFYAIACFGVFGRMEFIYFQF